MVGMDLKLTLMPTRYIRHLLGHLDLPGSLVDTAGLQALRNPYPQDMVACN